MQMTMRWYGSNDDSVTLKQIRQVPGVSGVVSALYDIPVGEVWPLDRIYKLKEEIEDNGLSFKVVESVNVHEDIKLGLPTRDKYIENYKQTLENLGKAGIKVVCYNFMPVFDWIRSELAKEIEDGSTILSYDGDIISKIDPKKIIEDMNSGSNGFSLPGWERERLIEIKELFRKYENVDEKQLLNNLKYFLENIISVAEKNNIKMAIHPDDPPWSIFGLPRIVKNKEDLERIINLVDSPYNGLTLCSGSLGSNSNNNLPELIRYFGKKGRVHFGHVRNIKIFNEKKFDEASHRTQDGSLDMYEIMKAYYDIEFEGPIRPDHGRMIWDEKARPGYGLYDRALGITYLNGLWEAIDKNRSR